MFQSARIRLTLWYLLIIMIITLLFNGVIYANVNQEYNKIERFEKQRQKEREDVNTALDTFRLKVSPGTTFSSKILLRRYDPQMIQQSRIRLLITLTVVDTLILVVAGFAGYFLAGRTLQPIKRMMDEQNRFVTDASHEIRTPLTSIKSSVEVNLRNRKLTLEQAKRILESNLEEVNNLQLLSDNLIQLTQYPNGSTPSFSPVNLKQVIHDAYKKVHAMAKKKQISITYDIAEIQVVGNKQLLTELFVIMLDNAVKYSPVKSAVTVETVHVDGKITIAISDQGIGIDAKEVPHIFDRFYRVDKARTKNDISGYGLGLSIARHIVSLHQGTISIKSKLAKGTTFFITLPKSH